MKPTGWQRGWRSSITARLLTVDTPAALKNKVGKGDVLEIELNEEVLEQAVTIVSPIAPQVTTADHILVIRARGVVELLPAILEKLKTVGIHPGEVRFRGNSLEDVFISLTGRRLRE